MEAPALLNPDHLLASTRRPTFASFWAGDSLSPYEKACLQSFTCRGYQVVLFSYDQLRDVPEQVTLGDASEIMDQRFANAYLIDGKASLTHFSDVFRYKLFEKTTHVWVDCDMLLLRPFDFELPQTLLAREDASSLCNAIMRLDQRDPRLLRLVARCESLAGRDLVWGETGPTLLTSVFRDQETSRSAYEPEVFFPIHYDDFWKPLLPEFRDECEALCTNAYTLHLWNNIVVKLGLWKSFMPPRGSFLQQRFEIDKTEHFFSDAYPAPVMRQMVENWRRRYDGADLALGPLARQLMPGIGITAKKRFGNLRRRLQVR